mmetsp:Transcript_14000/g.48557  ORF Transcript_14000/g.48557 Transcript_14000/m.48557 type:complete len:327 (-) Transcript_14000:859-1839(-)
MFNLSCASGPAQRIPGIAPRIPAPRIPGTASAGRGAFDSSVRRPDGRAPKNRDKGTKGVLWHTSSIPTFLWRRRPNLLLFVVDRGDERVLQCGCFGFGERAPLFQSLPEPDDDGLELAALASRSRRRRLQLGVLGRGRFRERGVASRLARKKRRRAPRCVARAQRFDLIFSPRLFLETRLVDRLCDRRRVCSCRFEGGAFEQGLGFKAHFVQRAGRISLKQQERLVRRVFQLRRLQHRGRIALIEAALEVRRFRLGAPLFQFAHEVQVRRLGFFQRRNGLASLGLGAVQTCLEFQALPGRVAPHRVEDRRSSAVPFFVRDVRCSPT